MTWVICPGIHDPSLTDRFLQSLATQHLGIKDYLVLPTTKYPPFSAVHVLRFLQQQLNLANSDSYRNHPPLSFIGYSAGVVGAMGAAWTWQQQGGKVQALIALDGWGVPLVGHFPIYRASHDYFTHWSSALLGHGSESFYADPSVAHLDLWRTPATTSGWWLRHTAKGEEVRSPTTAAEFINKILARHTASQQRVPAPQHLKP